jgi:hypothetical protein
MSVMATPPESTKISVGQRLRAHAAIHWPQAGELESATGAPFVYVEAHLTDGTVQPLIRLRYGGSARHWGPEEALDCACRLYLGNSPDQGRHDPYELRKPTTKWDP